MSIGSYEFRADPGTLVTVYTEIAGHIELVTLFTDQTGDTEGPNPLATTDGWIRIFAESGEYAMRVDQRSLPGALFNIGDDGPGGSPITVTVA